MEDVMADVVIIVDPYSTGVLYAPVFRQLGFSCWAVRSSNDIPEHFTCDFEPENFARTFSSAAEVLREAVPGSILAVVAGCETGVAAADQLAKEFDVRGNDPATSHRRRHKDKMQRALREAGLRNIPGFVFSSLAEFEQVSTSFEENEYVVKPINSAATDGVRFVSGHDELYAAMRCAGWDARNDLGEINYGFVVQEFIPGPEFVVDMVAFDDEYVTASVCRYDKREKNGAKFIYYGLDTLDPRDIELAPLVDYAKQAARALGIVVGPVHMELIWNERGPVMIEAAGRLHGGIAPRLFTACYDPDLLSLSVRSYLRDAVPAGAAGMRQFGRIAFLISERVGTFAGLTCEEIKAMKSLSSYCGHKVFIRSGDTVQKTIDFATCPGLVWLSASNRAAIDRDEMDIRKLFAPHLVDEQPGLQ
jgi:biotin carboxylase